MLAAPVVAQAANVFVSPQKPCYRSGERLGIGGGGYSPSSTVDITSNGSPIGSLGTDGQGSFAGVLTVGQGSGEKLKTYAATDRANSTLTAATAIKVSAVDARVHPRSSRPGRRLRINARGFTSASSLYAHIVRGRYRRTVRLGHLAGDCGELSGRKRVLPRSTRAGTYLVQFDGRRRYSRKTKVRVRFRVFVFRAPRRSSAAGARWVRVS